MATQPPHMPNSTTPLYALGISDPAILKWIEYWTKKGLPQAELEALFLHLEKISEDIRYVENACDGLDSEIRGALYQLLITSGTSISREELVRRAREMKQEKEPQVTTLPAKS